MSDETISGGTGFAPPDRSGGYHNDGGVATAPPPQAPQEREEREERRPRDVPDRYLPPPPTADHPNDRPLRDITHPIIAPPKDEEAEEKKREEEEKKNRPFYKKPLYIIGGIVLLLLIAGLAFGIPWYLNARQYQSTDDAIIDAHSERVAPQVSGRVLQVPVDDNQPVQAGQLLVQIDPAPFQAKVDQAAASLAQARGMLAQARAQKLVNEANVAEAQAQVEVNRTNAENAKRNLDRYEALSSQAVSQQTLDDARSTYRSAAANLTSAQKKVAAAQAQVEFADSQIQADEASVKSSAAQLEQANLQLSYCTVDSKSAGRVTRKSVSVGDYVSTAQQLMAVVPQDVYVTANFKETELTAMRVGQSVDIHVDSYPDQKFTGKVQSIQSGTGAHFSLLPPENATGNYVKVVQRVPVKITFDDTSSDAYKRLSPGMSVEPSVKIK